MQQVLCFRYNRDPGPIAEVRPYQYKSKEAAETEAVATIFSIGRGWFAKERFLCLVGAGAVWVAYGAY